MTRLFLLPFLIISDLTLISLRFANTSFDEHYSKLIQIDSTGISKGLKGNLWGLVSPEGKELTAFKYTRIGTFQKDYATFAIEDNSRYLIFQGYLDRTGKEFKYPYMPYKSLHWEVKDAPLELPDSSHILGSHKYLNFKWTLPSMLNHNLKAFIDEPQTYDDLGKLDQICIGYGMLISVGNYSEDYMIQKPDQWIEFKEKTLYPIIGNEKLRTLAWEWMKPYYKDAYSKLNPFVKDTYQECFKYLNDHMINFDAEKYAEYLKNDEKKFAKYDINGNRDSKRKLSAFVDRLILVHKIISPEDAKRWIKKLYFEVKDWE